MTEWYYRDPQSRKVGPLSTDEFEQLVSMGVVTPETRVWRPGLVEWTTYAALVAQEEVGSLVASGPLVCAARESRSYSTLIALGASPANCLSRACRHATPAASECATARAACLVCPGCGEEVAKHFFRTIIGGEHLCGFCAHQRETEALRIRRGRSTASRRLGKWLVRCALAGAAFVVVRAVFGS